MASAMTATTILLVGFLFLLVNFKETVSANSAAVPLNVGYIKLSDHALVESFAGGVQADAVDEVQEAMIAGVKMALHDITSEGALPQFNVTLVTATMENNTYSDVYTAATQLIQQKVAVFVILIGSADFLQYLAAIAEGFRVPVLAFACKLVAREDETCLSSSVRGETALQYFRAAYRLGFNRTTYIYNPTFLDSSVVETFASEMSSQIQVQSIQTRTDISNSTIQQILDSRISSVIITGPQSLPAYKAIRAAVGEERKKMYTFITALGGGGLTPNQITSTFAIGDEDGLFTMESEAPTALQVAYGDRIIREGWANTTDQNVPLMTAVLRVTSYRYYNLLRMWAYGFQRLVAGQSASVVASSMNARPKINRQVYYGNDTINAALGVRLRIVSGIPTLFTRFSVARPNLTEFNRTNPLWTPSCRTFLGFVDEPGRITNATFGDKSNIAPPDRVPLPIKRFGTSPIRSAGFAVGGIIIAFNVLLLALLLVLRSSPSIMSASWVLMGTTLLGSICLAVSLFLTTSDPTAADCNATSVLISLGLHLILVSIAVKAFRLSIIFRNTFHRRVALRDDKLAVIVGCLYIPDIILLAIWLSKRPLGPIFVEESGESQVLKCYSDTSGYPWALFAYGLVKLLVALRYTYLTRNVFSRFNETKTVLFAVYNVSIGLVIGIVSFAITGLQREGAMLLLLIALAGTSFGTSASVVGSRVIYAFVDMTSGNKRKFASNSGAVGGISKGKTDTGYDQNPQILGRRGLKDPLDVSMMSSGVSHFVADISTNAGKHKDEDYIGQGDLIGFEGSIRQRSMLVWTSKWYTCLILVGTVNKEPNLILSVYDGVTGSPKLAPTWSVVLAQNQVTDVAVVEGCAVKIDSTRGTFDIDFPSASLAARFVEEYERRIGKDNKVDDKRNGSKAS